MNRITEDQLEQTAIDWFKELKYDYAFGPDISPDPSGETLAPTLSQRERANYTDVVLVGRLRDALIRINPDIPAEAIDEAVRKIIRPESPSLIENNRNFHRMLT